MEPKLTGYVTGNISCLTNASTETMIMSTIGAGAKIENKNGYYAKLEGGYRNVTCVYAEAGKDTKFGESKFGINTSFGGQYTVAHKERDYYRNIFKEGANSPSWKPNDTRGYAQVALTYKTPAFKANLGIKAGVKTSTQSSLDGITLADVGEIIGTEYAGRTTKTFVNPLFGLEAGKKIKGKLEISDRITLGVAYYL